MVANLGTQLVLGDEVRDSHCEHGIFGVDCFDWMWPSSAGGLGFQGTYYL